MATSAKNIATAKPRNRFITDLQVRTERILRP
jgi:hypothetical protein